MIKEAYVSFEIAKLLKEKGFDECIFEFYEGDKIKYARNEEGFRLSELPDIYYPHITHQTACAWLREQGVYMSIDTVISSSGNIYFNIDTYSKNSGWNHPVDFHDSYEDAVETALKYSLENLI